MKIVLPSGDNKKGPDGKEISTADASFTKLRPGPWLNTPLGLDDVVKLASNENPEGPLPEVVAAVQQAVYEVNRYPDGAAYALTHTLSDFLGVEPGSILLGNGSNEVIDMLVRALRAIREDAALQ